jgi:hypothetical protein
MAPESDSSSPPPLHRVTAMEMEELDLREEPEPKISDNAEPYLPTFEMDSTSFTSVSSMMIVSGQDHENE